MLLSFALFCVFKMQPMSLFYRLAPMRLYSLSKRHFVLVFVVFLVCFALTVFIGVAGKTIVTMIQI